MRVFAQGHNVAGQDKAKMGWNSGLLQSISDHPSEIQRDSTFHFAPGTNCRVPSHDYKTRSRRSSRVHPLDMHPTTIATMIC